MSRRRSRTALLAIAALFILPLGLAWLMYSGTLEFQPRETVNQGRLVVPPVPLDWRQIVIDAPTTGPGNLAGAWVALYPLPDPCDATCQERVHMLRQVHRALGKDADRVRIASLATGASGQPERAAQLRDIHSGILLLHDPAGEWVDALRRAGEGAAAPSVYLVDPLGNIMMTYEATDSMNMLLEDLEWLLEWSRLDDASAGDRPSDQEDRP